MALLAFEPLLFLVLLFAAAITVITAIVSAFRGRRRQALAILRGLAFCAAGYVGIVYVVTAFSKQAAHGLRDPQCSDDWCIAVEGVAST